ncbi:MAG: hypothetical protein J0M12_08925 [Deltaproteobacteria bacterium]|nr:hypothetical protein [Deltaproteobacteria bacterium]
MNSFVESTADGLSITVNEGGQKIPFDRDMRIGFDDVAGAQVWLERRNGHITCAAALPESREPVLWRFDVCKDRVQATIAPTPIKNAKSIEKLISDCRIGLNGKL